MDYGGILKRAWNVTWKYKILWLFGLFAGGFGGSGGGGGGSGSNVTNRVGTPNQFSAQSLKQLEGQIAPYVGLIVAGTVVLLVIGIVFWIVGIAARGGLVHLVNEAEDGRQVRAGDGWARGFRVWWRTFAMELLLGLPALIIGGVTAVAVVIGVLGAVAGGNSSAAGSAVLSALGGMCFLLVIVVILAIAYGLIVGPVLQLALRYIVLKDQGPIEAIKSGWHDLWAKRGAFVMFLLMFAVGLGIGIASVIVFVPVLLVGFALAFLGPFGIGLAGLLVVAVAVSIGAVSGTFLSAAWTIFFRRMTGAEQVGAPVPAWGSAPSGASDLIGFPPAAGGFPPPPVAGASAPSPAAAPPQPAAPQAPPAPAPPAAPEVPAPTEPPTAQQPAPGDPKNPWEF
jgi:hypothetical protein